MSIALCRVCLMANRRMECIKDMALLTVFEKLASNQLNRSDGEPLSMCYICLRRLRRCRQYSDTAHRSAAILQDLYEKGLEVTEKSLLMLNMEPTELLSRSSVTCTSVDGSDTTDTEPAHKEPEHIKQETLELNTNIKIEETNVVDDNSERIHDADIKIEICDVIEEETADVKPLSSDLNIVIHKSNRSEQNQANFCNKITEDVAQMTNTFACGECNRTFAERGSLRTHEKTHAGNKPFSCGKHGKAFTERGSQATRARVHSGGRFACDLCHKSFTRRSTIVQHIRRHNKHSHDFPNCNRTFAPIQTLQTHFQRPINEFTDETSQKTFRKPPDLEEHAVTRNATTHVCNLCNKGFSNNRSLSKHMQTHTAGKTHACERCNKSFSLPVYLKRHMSTHASGRTFACTLCEQTFALRTYLSTHVKKKHSGISAAAKPRTHICDRCAKSFSNSNDLQKHLRAHRGVRPHACARCGKAFAQKSHLNEHSRVHTGERPFACSVCNKTFTQNSSMKFHMKSHSAERPHACGHCTSTFTNRHNLQKHERLHTGERPYSCAVAVCVGGPLRTSAVCTRT